MSSEWRKLTFGELIDAGVLEIGDGYRAKNEELSGGGLIFLRAGHVKDTHIDFNGVDRFSTSEETRFGRKISVAGDVVITTKGNSTGRIAVVTPDMPQFVYSPHLSYWRSTSEDVVTQGFLRAWARSSEFSSQLEGLSRSTDMAPYLSLRDQRRLEITLPPTDVQRVIYALSDALSARVELLRETNATLEAIAQTLFKSWFVDFDPVRAKRDGRAPEGMDEATAALFPDSFEESELGEVPRGWEVQAIGDCIDTVGGATPDTKNAAFWSPEEFAWTTPKDLSGATSPALISTERKLSAAGLAKISSGLLPKGSLLMSSRAPIGYLAIADLPVAINQGYIGMLPGGRLPPLYMLRWCEAHMDQIKGRANGSTFMEISKKAFRPIPAVVPHKAVIAAYMAVAQPLFDRVIANERQALTLIQVRDTLLPRLISGQLRLPEPHSLLEATA